MATELTPQGEPASQSELQVLGHIILLPELEYMPLQGYLVEAHTDNRLLAQEHTDGNGCFLLNLPPPQEYAYVELRIFDQQGELSSRILHTASELADLVPINVRLENVRNPELASPPRDIGEHPSSQVVNEIDLALLQRSIETVVANGGLDLRDTAWVLQDIEELERFHILALGAAEGEIGNIPLLEDILRNAPVWQLPEDYRPIPDGQRYGHHCFIDPRYPHLPMFAGIALSIIRGGQEWVHRAVGYYLSRVHGLNAVHLAASGLAQGHLGLRDFAGAIRYYAPPGVGSSVIRWNDALNHSSRGSAADEHLRMSFPPGAGGGMFTSRQLPHLEALNLCELEWMNCAYFFWNSGPRVIQATPKKIGSVEPSAVCSGFTGTLRLHPPPNETFDTQGTGWHLSIGTHAVRIIQSMPDWIDIEMPADIPAGCTDIGWTMDTTETTVFANEMRGACQRFVSSISTNPFPFFLHRGDVAFTVVGPATIERFNAAGQSPQLVAEACTPIELTWAASLDFCPGTAVQTEVALLADGTEFATGLSLIGTYKVAAPEDVTYTVRIRSFAETTECATALQTVTVKRFHALHTSVQGQIPLSPTDQTFATDVGSIVTILVRCSCPAPANGLLVTLTSSNPVRFPNGVLTIPQGQTQAAFTVNAGGDCGGVSVKITAPGHQAETIFFVITDTPTILGVTPVQVTACAPFTLSMIALCAGVRLGHPIGEPIIILSKSGFQVPAKILTMVPNGQDPFHGPTQIDAEVPGLLSGSYDVAIRFRGKTAVGTTRLQVQPVPPTINSFVVNPSQVISCIPTPVEVTWNVQHATQLKIFRDGMPIANLSRSEACTPWVGTQAVGLADRTATYRLEIASATGTLVQSATRTLQEMHGIYSLAGSITLRNKANRDLYIWSINSVGTQADLEELLFPGQSTTITIQECLRINLVAETTGDESEVLRSTYYWRWNLAILGRTGRVYPAQDIF